LQHDHGEREPRRGATNGGCQAVDSVSDLEKKANDAAPRLDASGPQ
jgi:hypothetical protein